MAIYCCADFRCRISCASLEIWYGRKINDHLYFTKSRQKDGSFCFNKKGYAIVLITASDTKTKHMINTIQIPKPCHQDWNAMTSNEQGRHCLQCCKTVVDFTNKEPEEIMQYLQAHATKSVCGRFTAAQINMPIVVTEEMTFHIFNSSLSYFKKIAALILITFGIIVSSANKGFSQTTKLDTIQNIEKPDTGFISPMMVGEVMYAPAHKPIKKKPAKKAKCHIQKAPKDSMPMMGKVAITPRPIMGAVQVTDKNQ
jgi:hypothetical protein